MRVGAVIAAAGRSRRMGQYKPMLPIGSMTIAQRVVTTLRQAGADPIVVVTGYRAEELEQHLAREGVVFLRNEQYESTQMFDSIKIGLEYLREKCDRILLTPVDVPLYTPDTVKRLIDSDAPLLCPAFEGQTGHPVLMAAALAETLLADDGSDGLRGALARCPEPVRRVEVQDQGILQDADTPDAYRELLRMQESL